jgi:uncharacterized Fe-S cluster-containing MiaB family protein
VKNRSVFHNFQKHLITVLRKVVSIKKAELSQQPSGNRAIDLWKIFVNLRSSSKKSLYIIFGTEGRENETSMKYMAQSIPELQRLLSKYSLRQIEEGQEALRKVVSRQISALSKSRLEQECKMKRID